MINTIVFDIGNVLVRWDPVLAFLPEYGDRAAAQDFLDRIGFHDLNLRADGGERFADLARELRDPDDAALLAAYPERYALTIAEPIAGTWALMDRLRDRGHAIHAITNWSAETWPIGVKTHPRLATSFGVTIVSGTEAVIKPDPRIFQILCDRAGVTPAECLFIDDSAANVAGARAAGMAAHHFTTPELLERDLTERGLV
ncbi:HAD-IA family hydrolase [Paracoccus sp. (in: a-proteobacteria)]|uniref:HAD-IA family hydrolase n=1 Tax=Paracoccus sp. TaxID=267 RepID=UPI0026DFCDBD|nr:HAD-IA family hydrolase [Paracoccus sp. (in: a-proteobacteria)]MDO5648285.1 HAD-IA family hydrolase [Paracoccus sp. (in: a-proteobacteria)]